MGGEREADLKTEDFHLHHLNLQVLSLLNVYARGEGWSVWIYLRGRALLVGEPCAVYGRSDGTLVGSVGDVDVLGLRVVLGFFVVGGEAGKVESSARGGGVRNVSGAGANAAGAKTSEEGGTVVLVRYSHLGEIGRVERSV